MNMDRHWLRAGPYWLREAADYALGLVWLCGSIAIIAAIWTVSVRLIIYALTAGGY